jgi:F-type H+-transporting ATPase subunit b
MPEVEIWVAVAFLSFLALLGYLGAHRKVVEGLDRRQMRIRSELDEARRLREEAQALLTELEHNGARIEGEAAELIKAATAEAERFAAEAKQRMDDFVARRSKMAEAKIAQAEAQALADVRAAAADAAIAAAEKILNRSIGGDRRESLIADGINNLRVTLKGVDVKSPHAAAE